MIDMKIKSIIQISMVLLLLGVIPAMATNESTNLYASDRKTNSITWSWTVNASWYNNSVYVDGVFVSNITSPTTGTQSYTKSGAYINTAYTISIRSTNMTGGYSNWVNSTNSTLATGLDITNITYDINSLGSVLSSVIGLLNTVIVNNISVFVTVVILIIVMFIVKRFGWSFADFFESILGGLFRKRN